MYGHNDGEERKALWHHLSILHNWLNKEAWLITGDFNIVRHNGERQGGVGVNAEEVMEYNNCLNSIEVEELTTTGYYFTWNNKRGGQGNIQSKIDRLYYNVQWMQQFDMSNAGALDPGISDHCPLKINIKSVGHGKKTF